MPHTILSVDGDAAVRSARNRILHDAGFEVVEAADGPGSLNLASDNQPALVVLAMELPGMDGLAACRRLKADPRTASIPVLHIAGPGEPYGGYPESLESGADAWLQEPLDPPVLIAAATALIRARSARAGASKAEGDALSDAGLPAPIEAASLFPEQNPAPVMRVGDGGVLLYANPGSNALMAEWGCELGKAVPGILRHAVEQALAQGAPAEFDVRGGGRDYSFVIAPIAGCRYANVYGRDLTQRQRLADQLREHIEESETVMDVAPVAIWVSRDPRCQEITGNRMAARFYEAGAEENVSANVTTVRRFFQGGRELEPRELPMQQAAARGVDIRDYELDVLLPSGRLMHMLGNASPLRDAAGQVRGCVGTFLDITERKRAETRLRDSQKLESLGLLAGGVAHDFNNLLVGVIGNASLAQEMLPPGNPALELLEGVIRTGEQAAHLTRQMLAYSGKGKFLVEPVDLSALIPEMSGLVRPSISKKIALQLDLAEDLPPVEADRGQMQQVFMNLTLNAAEAIGSHEGLIAVRTGVQDVDELFMRFHPEAAALRPGKYVCLEVRDNGCGMDDATRAKIFDPFFSTKFTGRGLGLAAVAGIVRGHKAAITVSSAPGKGSCFTVLFPAAAGAAGGPSAADRDMALQGSGVVLVVDDEPIVRDMVRIALERHGYTVLLADSGLAAVDIFKRYPGQIALVVLDLSMPQMSGEEALPEIRKIRPDVKALVSSGYSEAETMTLFKGQRVSGFIQKPYTSKGIAEKVKVCLG